ncbi:hypothetical protein [Candidatus Viridilinea mediisalina]|uniref:Addiction module protein n=1 Tax=Candidatus Viridilinea mediisalina TaxID=2024553 RepID=A0A2A6RED5_9CHLR|nr:hypothetical protein [Candidatus Viridilinea mediisalina]PDW00970.1 hypothetical protein CJ255_19935 [Candidatus Viridilinea mediisalina]
MTTTETPTLDHVLILATRLPPADKLRLIERLAPQVAQVLPTTTEMPSTILAELDALVAEATDLGPLDRDSIEVIGEMRR